MIRATLASLAGARIARDVERGHLPGGLSVPLTLLAAKLPAPALVAGVIGYGLYRLNIVSRAKRATDVTPKSPPMAPATTRCASFFPLDSLE